MQRSLQQRGWRIGRTWAALAVAGLAITGCALPRGSQEAVCDLSPIVLDEPRPQPPSEPDWNSPVPEDVGVGADTPLLTERIAPIPAVVVPAAVEPTGTGGDYRVQPLDALRIDVYGESDISGVFFVSAEGAVKHPLLASVEVAGMTVAAVEQKFVELLGSGYLVHPRISVRVEHSTGRRVTILGEIKKPGTYTLPPEQPLTLLGLVATAGGFTDIAEPKRVRILRDTGDSRDNTIRVNVNDLLKGRLEQTDIKLLPGDVIMVPESIF